MDFSIQPLICSFFSDCNTAGGDETCNAETKVGRLVCSRTSTGKCWTYK